MTPKLAKPLFKSQYVPASELRNQGWMHLRFGRKAHYFRNNISLCGRFRLEGKDFRMYGLPGDFRADMDCPTCFKVGSQSDAEVTDGR